MAPRLTANAVCLVKNECIHAASMPWIAEMQNVVKAQSLQHQPHCR